MNTKLLFTTFSIAALTMVASTVPALAAPGNGNGRGWGGGNIPPGLQGRLGYFGNNLGGGYGNWSGNSGMGGWRNGGNGGNGGMFGGGYGGGCERDGDGGSGSGSGFGGFGGGHHHHHHHHQGGWMGGMNGGSGWNTGNNGFLNNTGSGLFNGNNQAALTQRLAQRQQYLQGLLAQGNLPADRATAIQNQLNRLAGIQNNIAGGTFTGGSGGLRGLLGF